MTLRTILAYQVGHADSIRSVAPNRVSIGVGAVLVLTAAIARNGDQRFILEDPLWPAGPLIISLIASFLIYGVAHPLLYRRDKDGERPRFWRQYPIFLGLFWMTAPITRKQTVQLPLAWLSGVLVLFVTFAIWCQTELARNYRVQTLMTDGNYREALDYLGTIDSSDLSPTRPVFPNPFENEVFAHLHGVFGALTERDPEWIRSLYLDHLTVRVRHSSRLGEPMEFVTIFESLERLPGGQAWIDDNRDTVRQIAQYTLGYEMADSDRSRLTASLQNLGIRIDEDWR